MKIGAGIVGILVGLSSILYVGVYGGMLAYGAGWVGSWGGSGNSVSNWAEMVSTLSWLAPLLAIVGGIITFSYPQLGAVILGASAFAHYSLLGYGRIGQVFVSPLGAAAILALISPPRRKAQPIVIAPPAAPAQSDAFDRSKWNALLEYDKDLSAAAARIRPFGDKWLDEFAAAFLALSDKQYLSEIVDRISSRAKAEEADHAAERVRQAEREEAEKKELQRLAQLRRERRAIWQQRVWGSRRKKVLTSGAVALILVASAGTILQLTAPPPRLTERITWSGEPENCFELECVREQMQKSGANSDAIQFTEKLTAKNKGPSWATHVRNFGQVDLVAYNDVYGRGGGYVFVDRDLRIIGLSDGVNWATVVKQFEGFSSNHPQAFALRGTSFIGQSTVSSAVHGEQKRLLFQCPVGDCEACEPLGALEFGYDFDKDGHYAGFAAVDIRSWSQRLPSVPVSSTFAEMDSTLSFWDVRLGTPVSQVKGLDLDSAGQLSTCAPEQCYRKHDEKLEMGPVKLQSVVYHFFDKKLVSIQLFPVKEQSAALLDELYQRFGNGEAHDDGSRVWAGERVTAMYVPSGEWPSAWVIDKQLQSERTQQPASGAGAM